MTENQFPDVEKYTLEGARSGATDRIEWELERRFKEIEELAHSETITISHAPRTIVRIRELLTHAEILLDGYYQQCKKTKKWKAAEIEKMFAELGK